MFFFDFDVYRRKAVNSDPLIDADPVHAPSGLQLWVLVRLQHLSRKKAVNSDLWMRGSMQLLRLCPQVDDHRVLLRLRRLPQKGRELRSVDRCRSCACALRSTTLGSCSTSTSIAQKGCELRSLDAWIDAAPALVPSGGRSSCSSSTSTSTTQKGHELRSLDG